MQLADPKAASQFSLKALVPMAFCRHRADASFLAGGSFHEFQEMTLTHMWARGCYSAERIRPGGLAEQMLMTVCVGGGCTMQARHGLTIAAGETILLAGDEIQGFSTREGLETISVRMPRRWIREAVGETVLNAITGRPMQGDKGMVRILADTIMSFWHNRESIGNAGARATADALVGLARAALEQKSSHLPASRFSRRSLYWRVHNDIQDNMACREATGIGQTAMRLGTSPRIIQAALREAGTTFTALVMELRLARAAEVLRSRLVHHRTIAELAFSLGFEDPAHFSRRFRQQYGTSPSQYACDALAAPAGRA